MYARIAVVQLVVALALICTLLFTRSEHVNSLFRRQTDFGDIGAAASSFINELVSADPFNTPAATAVSATTTTSSSIRTSSSTTSSTASRTSTTTRSSSSSRKTSSSSSRRTTSSSKTSTTSHHTTTKSTSIPRTTVRGTFIVTKYTTEHGSRVAKTFTSTGNHVVTGTAALNHGGDDNGGHGLTSNDKKIIGGVVGGIGGAALLGGLILLFFKLRKRRSDYDDDDDLMMDHKGSYYDSPAPIIGETNTNGLERYASRSGTGTSPSAAPSSVPVSANF